MTLSRYTSRDGLCTSADASAVALWDSIGDRMASEQRDWIKTLRGMGVKLAHPDDGWVKREAPEPFLSLSWYPQFNDEPQEGDLIALGASHHCGTYAGDKGGKWRRNRGRGARIGWQYRLVRVVRVNDHAGILGRFVDYYFEDTGVRLPPEPTLRERLRLRRSS
jgi:hypothetical protein